MERITRLGVLLAIAVWVGSCSGKETTSDDSGGTGGNSGGGSVVTSGASAGAASGAGAGQASGASGSPNLSPLTCGADCVADLPAARAALEAGDFSRALELYRCADTPEAAFGAGLSRIMTAVEGANADTALADLGLPHFPANALLGPGSGLVRWNSRWVGTGALSLTGDVALDLSFERGHLEQDSSGDQSLEMVDLETANLAQLTVDFSLEGAAAPLAAGTALAVTYDCTKTYPARSQDPRLSWLNLSFKKGGEDVRCQIPFSATSGPCVSDGGRVLVTEPPATGGQAGYALENLLLECSSNQSPGYSVRATGSVKALFTAAPLDLTDLHPLFDPELDVPARMPAGVQATEFIQHLAQVTGELEEAGCYFRKAAQGTGTVFSWPGKLHGGVDVAFSQGDTELLASASLAFAAAGQLATAYGLPMALKDLSCDGDTAGCPTAQQLVETFNSVFARVFHADRFVAAERLFNDSLALLEGGIGHLDERSLFVRNGVSQPGLDALRELVQSLRRSLASGRVVLPQVSPALSLDLRAFFAQPRNPSAASAPPLLFTETCDEYDCWSDTQLNTTFLNEHFAGVTDADWANGDYRLSTEEACGDALGETLLHAVRRFFVTH